MNYEKAHCGRSTPGDQPIHLRRQMMTENHLYKLHAGQASSIN